MIVDTIPRTWFAIGFLGQAMFSGLFVVQWIASERKRASVIPTAFWWLSVAGGAVLLVYGRNLVLSRRIGRSDGA